MTDQWQISFDDGHQQRYLPDRRAVLSYVLSIGPRAASPRFEVFAGRERDRPADGRPAGREFTRVDVIDLRRPGEVERLRAELARLDGPGEPGVIDAPGGLGGPGPPGAAGAPS